MANEPVGAPCPYCGQPLQSEEAVRHLGVSERKQQSQLRAVTREHELADHDEELIEERAKHRIAPF